MYFLYKNISERKTILYCQKNIKTAATIVDIGANIGFHSLLFSKLVGNSGKVYSFEPDSINFKHLKQNCSHRKNIIVNKLAVAEKTKTIKLFLSSSLNVDHQTYDSGENRQCKSIKAVSLDDFFPKNISIDLIKIDTQGYDHFALLGCKKIISRQKKLTIIGEMWPYGLKASGSSVKKYYQYLKELGFKLKIDYSLSSLIRQEKNKEFYTDFIATKINVKK